MKRASILTAVLTFVACGSNSPTAPAIAQVSGVWNYTSVLTSVSGGECVGGLLASAVGTADRGTLSVNQSGSSLTATSRSSFKWGNVQLARNSRSQLHRVELDLL
jgi:hypothetical protein